jgi:hypothetical protein
MLASSFDPDVSRMDPEVTERIRRHTEMSLCYYRSHPDEITLRLRELEEEWDVERTLEAVSSTLSLMGFTWGLFRKRWWLIGLAAQGFFWQHAVRGWAPPVEFARRLGFRTLQEIENERRELLRIRSVAEPGVGAGEATREPAFEPA